MVEGEPSIPLDGTIATARAALRHCQITALDRIESGIASRIGQIIDLALELAELSPRELAVRFTDERKYFVSRRLRSIDC